MAPFVIRACPGSTWATPGADGWRDKNENFCWSTPNDPIRKVNRLESIFEHLPKILPTTGWSQPSLRNFPGKKKKALHKIDFGTPKGWSFKMPSVSMPHVSVCLSVCRLWFDKYETTTNLMLSEVALQNLPGKSLWDSWRLSLVGLVGLWIDERFVWKLSNQVASPFDFLYLGVWN